MTVYTNSTQTPVDLPYFGTDARLRIARSGFFSVPGFDWEDEIRIPTNIVITGFENPELLSGGYYVPNNYIVSPPTYSLHAARLDTVREYYTNATEYAVTRIEDYGNDAAKVVRGSIVQLGNNWHFETAQTTNSSSATINFGGFDMIGLDIEVAAHEVQIDAASSTNIVMSVSTNGVSYRPEIEWCAADGHLEWRPVTVIDEDWPTASSNRYSITIEPPDAETAFFRCLSVTSRDVTINGYSFDGDTVTWPSGMSITATNGVWEFYTP
ncbi:hypothetical protein EGM51_10595 [Verrucomicrobia bacterium S94]|nr:hypothetical protein EGM51_10595 [Verrucomicrobia bacterium S94]